jgi:hypothetical protein
MAETNARNNQETRDTDATKEELRESVMQRMVNLLGKAYDNALTREVVSGLRDGYRRVFEQGFYGTDLFDGRWAMDRPKGQEQATAEMGKGYSQAQSFYGYDNDRQDRDLERDQDRDLGR